jgi:hypothetical protein
MAKVIVPSDAPKIGDKIYVMGGKADGRETEYTGLKLQYVDVGRMPDERGVHHYELREKQHVVTGEKMWVYEYVGTD